MKYLLDTHTWLWWHTAPRELSKRAASLIALPDDQDEILLSAISIWEFCKLVEIGRLALKTDGRRWLGKALKMNGLRLVDLTPEICWASTTLPGRFHKDPADQIIVATAREEGATIITKDRLLSSYEHVNVIW